MRTPEHLKALYADEGGFIISAELVLIATIVVIGLIVGLAEVQSAVVEELNDVGEAIGNLNQSFIFTGFTGFKQFGGGFGGGGAFGGIKARTFGSIFLDSADECDRNECQIACFGAAIEAPKFCASAAPIVP